MEFNAGFGNVDCATLLLVLAHSNTALANANQFPLFLTEGSIARMRIIGIND